MTDVEGSKCGQTSVLTSHMLRPEKALPTYPGNRTVASQIAPLC